MKFLVISPSPELQQKLTSASHPADGEFVFLSKAGEALGALKSQKFAAVIFDAAVSDLDPKRLVKKILQREPNIILIAVAPTQEISTFQKGLFFQTIEAFPKEGQEALLPLLVGGVFRPPGDLGPVGRPHGAAVVADRVRQSVDVGAVEGHRVDL